MKAFQKRHGVWLVVAAVFASASARAQDQAQSQKQVEEVVVTGSYIPAQSQHPQPITVINSNDIQQLDQRSSIAEIFKNVPQVTGSTSTINSQEPGGNSPTSTINLRGLGARATLVLLNGKRQTIDGSGTGVDVDNLVPSIMIDHIEMLTDGASATYGSDAVAGVVNFITRKDFEGTEVRVNMQKIQASPQSKPDAQVSLLTGAKSEHGSIVAGLEVNRTESVLAQDVFSQSRLLETLHSSFANPGSFVPGTTGSIVAGRIPDPLCGNQSIAPGLRAGLLAGTACTEVNALGRALQPQMTRITGLAVADEQYSHSIRAEYEIGFAHSSFKIPFGFVTPLLPPLLVVPANNPGVLAAHAADPNFVVQPYRWWGRPLSTFDGETGAIHTTQQDTYRLSAQFNGPIAKSKWQWQLAGTVSRNQDVFTDLDTLNSRITNALNGYGGPNCQYTPQTDPTQQFQGVGDCMWFNPFGNHALASPGDPAYNDPSVINYFVGTRVNTGTAKLATIDGLLTGNLFKTAGGMASLAVGYQHRRQDFAQAWDEITQGGFNPVTGVGFRFNQNPLPNFSGTRYANSVFSEFVVYPAQSLEVQLAARYDNFGEQQSTNPKLGIIWSPGNKLSFRGTYGTSFQLPREIELFGRTTGSASVRSLGGEGINARGVSVGNPNLNPITSTNWTAGFTWNATGKLNVSLDWWSIKFKNLVAAQSADLILLNDMKDGFITAPQIVLYPGAPNEVCEVTGRWDPNSGLPLPAGCISGTDIESFVTSYINQDAVNTSGLDFTFGYNWTTSRSQWSLGANGTWTHQYDIFSMGQKFDGVGSYNDLNLGVPNAEWRGNITLDWQRGDYFAHAMLHYISKLKEDDKATYPLTQERQFKTLDLVFGVKLRRAGFNITAAILNVFNSEDPTKQTVLLPVTTSIYDWRRRVFRVGFGVSFGGAQSSQ